MSSYFEKRASDYLRKSRSGLWKKWREKEWMTVVSLLNPSSGRKLIDLGCGAGFYSIPLRELFGMEVVAVDSSPAMIEALQEADPYHHVQTVLRSMDNLNGLGEFDCALAAGSLEFTANPAAVIAQTAQHLKAGGDFIVLVPATGVIGTLYEIYHRLSGCPTYVRSVEEYRELFVAQGFHLQEIRECTCLSVAMKYRKPET